MRDTLNVYGPGVYGVRVSPGSSAAASWGVDVQRGEACYSAGGGMHTSGALGSITGRSGHLQICDDPIKNERDASSDLLRERVWNWWRQTWLTRRAPRSTCVLVMTRWHADDLVARILESDSADEWDVLHLRALATDDDPLGREPGAPLWPEVRPLSFLEEQRKAMGSLAFSALYQGDPTPADGALFKREWFREYRLANAGDVSTYVLGEREAVPHYRVTRRFITCDLAASTKDSADYTVAMVWGVTIDGNLVLLDTHRARMEGPDVVPMLFRLRDQWQVGQVWMERAGLGLTLVQDAVRRGLPVRELEADRDKYARAMAATPLLEQGKVWVPADAPWTGDLVAEALQFPKAKHDDMVDALAYGVRVYHQQGLGVRLDGSYASALRDLANDPRTRRTSSASESWRSRTVGWSDGPTTQPRRPGQSVHDQQDEHPQDRLPRRRVRARDRWAL